jgi:CRISPR system Cascade subunit CasE
VYLSRLLLNPASAHVQRDAGDVVRLHKRVMAAVPDVIDPELEARAYYQVLYRLESEARTGGFCLYVQSAAPPDWSTLPAGYLLPAMGPIPNPAVRPVAAVYEQLRAGRVLRFRLQANPTRKVDTKSGPNGERRNGRRVPLRSPEAQVAWLKRKAAEHGFQVLEVRVAAGGRALGRGSLGAREVTVEPVLFEGRLLVMDAERFRGALRAGIGPGKAWGCGLLSVGPG